MTVKEKGIRSKNKILDVAEKCLKEQGVRDLNIDDVCKKAGLTRGAFYHHFKDRNHLLEELLKKLVGEKAEQYAITQNAEPLNMLELISFFIGKLDPEKNGSKNNEEQIQLFLDLARKAFKDKTLRDYIIKVHMDFISSFLDIIKDKSKKELPENTKYYDLARIFLALSKSSKGEAMNMLFSLFISSDSKW
ncbi:MAG: TetR/AcrR family transcriptional regulator [Actinobacteria bacterium]|nr:TetR/AcrR family transcriptional regulator [Actinomycetota bacterium]